jgi:hypothetical protein
MLFGARLRFSNSSGRCPQPNEHHNSLLSGNSPGIPGGWVLRSLADGLLAMPVAERGGDLRASQEIVHLPAVLAVIGGQQVEHIVTGLAAQQGEQGPNSVGCDHVRPVVGSDRVSEELADAWPGVVAGHAQRSVVFELSGLELGAAIVTGVA